MGCRRGTARHEDGGLRRGCPYRGADLGLGQGPASHGSGLGRGALPYGGSGSCRGEQSGGVAWRGRENVGGITVRRRGPPAPRRARGMVASGAGSGTVSGVAGRRPSLSASSFSFLSSLRQQPAPECDCGTWVLDSVVFVSGGGSKLGCGGSSGHGCSCFSGRQLCGHWQEQRGCRGGGSQQRRGFRHENSDSILSGEKMIV